MGFNSLEQPLQLLFVPRHGIREGLDKGYASLSHVVSDLQFSYKLLILLILVVCLPNAHRLAQPVPGIAPQQLEDQPGEGSPQPSLR